jgi:hypothetical protein
MDAYDDYYDIVVDRRISDIGVENFANSAQDMLVDYLRSTKSTYGDEVAKGCLDFWTAALGCPQSRGIDLTVTRCVGSCTSLCLAVRGCGVAGPSSRK